MRSPKAAAVVVVAVAVEVPVLVPAQAGAGQGQAPLPHQARRLAAAVQASAIRRCLEPPDCAASLVVPLPAAARVQQRDWAAVRPVVASHQAAIQTTRPLGQIRRAIRRLRWQPAPHHPAVECEKKNAGVAARAPAFYSAPEFASCSIEAIERERIHSPAHELIHHRDRLGIIPLLLRQRI